MGLRRPGRQGEPEIGAIRGDMLGQVRGRLVEGQRGDRVAVTADGHGAGRRAGGQLGQWLASGPNGGVQPLRRSQSPVAEIPWPRARRHIRGAQFARLAYGRAAEPRVGQSDIEGERKPADPDPAPGQLGVLPAQRVRPGDDPILDAARHDPPEDAIGAEQQEQDDKAEKRAARHGARL